MTAHRTRNGGIFPVADMKTEYRAYLTRILWYLAVEYIRRMSRPVP